MNQIRELLRDRSAATTGTFREVDDDDDDDYAPPNDLSDNDDSPYDQQEEGSKKRKRVCRHCSVPMKGHRCPHRRKRIKKRSKYGPLAEDTILEYQTTHLIGDTHSDARLVTSIKSSRTFKSNFVTQVNRNVFLKELEKGNKYLNADTATTNYAKDSKTSKVVRKSKYHCALCGLPLKGHSCPFKNPYQCKANLAASTDDNYSDQGEKLSTASACVEKEAWTEIMAPAHILEDEIHAYIMERTKEHPDGTQICGLAESEKKYLQSWSSGAYNQLLEQNQLILENLEISARRKTLAKSVSLERDELIALQARIRRFRNEKQQLTDLEASQQQAHASNTAAKRFLDAIDVMRLVN